VTRGRTPSTGFHRRAFCADLRRAAGRLARAAAAAARTLRPLSMIVPPRRAATTTPRGRPLARVEAVVVGRTRFTRLSAMDEALRAVDIVVTAATDAVIVEVQAFRLFVVVATDVDVRVNGGWWRTVAVGPITAHFRLRPTTHQRVHCQ